MIEIFQDKDVLFINKWTRVLLLMIFGIVPFLDLLTGFFLQKGIISDAGLFTPSQIGRFLCIGLMLCILSNVRIPYKILVPILYLLGIEIFSFFYHQNLYGFLFGILFWTKIVYLYLLVVLLYLNIRNNNSIEVIAFYLSLNLTIISVALILSFMTGIGESTYGWGFGTKSYFASGNGLGLYLGSMILFLITCNYYNLYRNKLSSFIVFLLALSLIATKTALLLLLVGLVYLYLVSKFKFKKTVLLLLLIFLAYSVSLIFEGLKSIFDVVFLRFESSDSMLDFIASGRNNYIIDAIDVFTSQDHILLRSITGSGAFLSFQDPSSVELFDTLETDFFDIFFMYGLLGIFFYLYYIFKTSNSIKKYKMFEIVFLLLAFHSIFAGHAIFNGMSVNALAAMIALGLYFGNNSNLNLHA